MSDSHRFVDRLVDLAEELSEAFSEAFSEDGNDPLAGVRTAALKRLETGRVPTRKDEEWRFFDVRPITAVDWHIAGSNGVDATELVLDEARDNYLVVRDGVVDETSTTLGDAAYASSIGDLPEAEQRVVLDALGSTVTGFDDDLFANANTALLRDVVCVVVPPDTAVESPIQVIFTAEENDSMQSPRLVVVAGSGSKFTVVEDYHGGTERHFTNAVTEFVVGESANVHHVRVQRESEQAMHVARVGARVGRFARYDSVHVALGASSSRHDIWVSHDGEDGWSRLDGLAMVDGKRESDTHTVVDNTRVRCESHQLHKCIVDDRGHAVFNGKIFVRHGAQKIDAYQLNRNLLLSPRAKVDTKPQLEIWADDVQCTHGATVGQLDPEQLFYLTSRGITEEEALSTLTYAFAAEVIESIEVPTLARALESEASARTMRTGR